MALKVKGVQFSVRDKEKVAYVGEAQVEYGALNPKMLVTIGQQFGLGIMEIRQIMDGIIANIPNAIAAVKNDPSLQLDKPSGLAAGKKHLPKHLAEKIFVSG